MTSRLYQVHVQIVHEDCTKNANFVDWQIVEFKQALRITKQFRNSLSVIGAIKITTQIVEIPSHENTKPVPVKNTEEHAYYVKVRYTENGTKKSWIAPLVDTLPQAIQRAGRIGKSLREKGCKFVKTQCVQFVAA